MAVETLPGSSRPAWLAPPVPCSMKCGHVVYFLGLQKGLLFLHGDLGGNAEGELLRSVERLMPKRQAHASRMPDEICQKARILHTVKTHTTSEPLSCASPGCPGRDPCLM